MLSNLFDKGEYMRMYRCLYCGQPCKAGQDEKGKYYMECTQCGKRELTKLGFARYEAQGELDKK